LECPSCETVYTKLDVIHINPISTEITQLSRDNMEDRRSKNREGKNIKIEFLFKKRVAVFAFRFFTENFSSLNKKLPKIVG
jgi:hypothetical protein